MFTGIIEQVGKIQKIKNNRFTIRHNFNEALKKGESISLSGACMTVIESNKEILTVEIMEESRNKTIFGNAHEGDCINLERSAKIGDRNSGHFVTGHIDEMGRILNIRKIKDFHLFRISFSKKNFPYLVKKGSIAVEGISLTVSDLSSPKEPHPWFEVSIISHTWKETNLYAKKVGDGVNIEFDMLGKYVVKKL